VFSGAAQAQSGTRATKDERYVPTIWIDPDGCEHWVMDDGAEGFGDNRLRRDGTPICHEVNVCGVMNTDQFFATDSYRIGAGGQDRLRSFFSSANAFAYTIVGHTDSRASDEYNMRLSYNRANAVAAVASGMGARVIDVRGYGERVPAAPNTSAAGMAKNRRVEILCFR
jgi:outer membrane protein OmpA-like peptidoglycan-associated protein